MRAADKVISSLVDLGIKEITDTIVGTYNRLQGPAPQTEAVPDLIQTKVRSIAAPALDKERRPKDTFADEFGSDIN